VAEEPGGTLDALHATGDVFGQDHDAPPELATATETKAELLGVASVSVPVLQLLGPRFVMTCVYVMLFPAVTGLGVPLFVTDRSQITLTLVVTVVLLFALFGSDVVAETVDVAVIVPIATVEGTFTTTTISAEDPELRLEPSVQFTVPVAPTAGVVQVQPAGASTDWKVVFVGVASLKAAPVAAAGPLFVTVCVYVMLFPA